MGFIVAVDGPAGSGKGSITQIVAERLNLVTIDTGAMYRSVTLAMLEQNVGIDDLDKIVEILHERDKTFCCSMLKDVNINAKTEEDIAQEFMMCT